MSNVTLVKVVESEADPEILKGRLKEGSIKQNLVDLQALVYFCQKGESLLYGPQKKRLISTIGNSRSSKKLFKTKVLKRLSDFMCKSKDLGKLHGNRDKILFFVLGDQGQRAAALVHVEVILENNKNFTLSKE